MHEQTYMTPTRRPARDAAMRLLRLSVEQRSALALLAGAGMNGLTETIMLARGFTRAMLFILVRKGLAILVRKGLATARWEPVKAGGRTIEVGRVRITVAGRKALES
jgi:hypothetical protein